MISICMIVKNSEEQLGQCLEPLLPLGYEVIVVDTGSTDNTKQIAKKYTDKVYDYIWRQDFSAARNYSVSKATNKYVLVIDSDEVADYFDKDELERLIRENPDGVGRLVQKNSFIRDGETFRINNRVGRLFSKDLYEYKGKIHEQPGPIKDLESYYYDIPVEVDHRGYDGDLETRKKKTNRNITILLQQLEDDGDDPYILYQLGKSFYMQEDYEAACSWFDKALYFDLDIRLEYVQDMVESYGYALINSKQYEKSMQLLGVYDEFAISADFVYLMGLIYMNNAKFTEAIDEFIKATKMKFHKMDGVNSYRAYYNIGVIYECLGLVDKAKTYYNKCGDYEPALVRLRDNT
ncbi:MAG: glycosyltransferase [Clostridiales bacterium]|nr:glycosyltransferase [Clostridiales bacterium]